MTPGRVPPARRQLPAQRRLPEGASGDPGDSEADRPAGRQLPAEPGLLPRRDQGARRPAATRSASATCNHGFPQAPTQIIGTSAGFSRGSDAGVGAGATLGLVSPPGGVRLAAFVITRQNRTRDVASSGIQVRAGALRRLGSGTSPLGRLSRCGPHLFRARDEADRARRLQHGPTHVRERVELLDPRRAASSSSVIRSRLRFGSIGFPSSTSTAWRPLQRRPHPREAVVEPGEEDRQQADGRGRQQRPRHRHVLLRTPCSRDRR